MGQNPYTIVRNVDTCGSFSLALKITYGKTTNMKGSAIRISRIGEKEVSEPKKTVPRGKRDYRTWAP